jgi:hypothetical protein
MLKSRELKWFSVVLWVGVFGLCSCAAQRSSVLSGDVDSIVEGSTQGDFSESLRGAEQAWQGRATKESLQRAINMWEAAAKMKTPDWTSAQRAQELGTLFESLARAYYLMADSHLRLEAKEEGEKDDAMMAVFEMGVTAAEKAIALRDPTFASAVAADPTMWEEAVQKGEAAAIPALYWYATNLGKWALLEGIATILSRKDDIKATMNFIETNRVNYFYHAPGRYFGVYHTKVPIGGGDPPKSRKAFESSIAAAPNYLATRVLMAETYAVLVGDPDLFSRLLTEVVNAPPGVDPAIEPENQFEQEKARRLLAQKEDLFY